MKPEIIETVVNISRQRIPLIIRRNTRARQLVLRIDQINKKLIVTLPVSAGLDEAFSLVECEEKWILSEINKICSTKPFEPGTNIPFLGSVYLLCHVPEERGGVWMNENKIFVAGRAEHLKRRLHDWFRKEAKRLIKPLAEEKAAFLGKTIGRIVIKDTKTRWGSCSTKGNLNFSWRVVLMPLNVFEYIVIHEVAHLQEPNHGKSFWRLVNLMHPLAEQAENWLKTHGDELQRIGR